MSHIKTGKFAMLDDLVSSRDLGPEMVGRHGYVYSIALEGGVIATKCLSDSRTATPALRNRASGPALAPVLARLQKEH